MGGIFGGLFQGKTVTRVSTSVSRVVEDDLLPNSAKTGAIRSIIQDDDLLVENVMDAMLTGPGVSTERMRKWAKKKYIYGLPSATFVNTHDGNQVIQGIIEAVEGRPVTLDYSEYAPFNSLHYGWKLLMDTQGYDPATNEITALHAAKGSKVYLVNMVAIIPESLVALLDLASLTQWGTAANVGYTPRRPAAYLLENIASLSGDKMAYVISPTAEAESILFTYCWEQVITETIAGVVVTRKEYREESFDFPIPLSQEDQNDGYFQVKYHYDDETGPTITESMFGEQVVTHNYTRHYKYFTYRNGSGTYPELDSLYDAQPNDLGSFFPFAYYRYGFEDLSKNKTTEHFKSSKKLVKHLGMDYASMGKAINENPDIKDVTQAIMLLGVPATTTNPLEQRYLFDFFKRAYLETGSVASSIFSEVDRILGTSKAPAITSIIIQDKKFKMSLAFRAIRHQYKAGVLGAVGTYTSSNGTETKSTQLSQVGEGGLVEAYTLTEDVEFHVYRKQTSPTIYEEVKVYGLSMAYHIDSTYTTTAAGSADTLLIPLDAAITDDYGIVDREVLFARALHFVFNAKMSTKLKWYQAGWFKVVLTIVAIVWTVWTWGSDGGAGASALLSASAAVIVQTILINVAIALAIRWAVSFIARAVGGQVAMVLGVILSVVAIAYGGAQGLKDAPWASTLLSASNGLIQAGFKELSVDLQEDYAAFNIEKELKVKELEEANKLLETQTILNPFTVFGEAPWDYYNRTVHAGNIGIQAIDAIHNYVGISLTLPKLSQTIPFDVSMLT